MKKKGRGGWEAGRKVFPPFLPSHSQLQSLRYTLSLTGLVCCHAQNSLSVQGGVLMLVERSVRGADNLLQ